VSNLIQTRARDLTTLTDTGAPAVVPRLGTPDAYAYRVPHYGTLPRQRVASLGGVFLHAAPALPRQYRPISARAEGGRTVSMRRLLPRLARALLLAAAAAWAAVHHDQINLTTLDAWLGSLGTWAPIVIGEGRDGILTDAVDAQATVFWEHVDLEFPQPFLILAELFGDIANGEDV
jgi:hypothetical protein